MTIDGNAITEELLNAFVDGELAAADAQRVARAVAADPALAQRAAALRADRRRLAETYAPLLDRPLPPAWIDRLSPAGPRRGRLAWPAAAIAAALALVLAGWLVQQYFLAVPADPLVAQALAARDGGRQPERRLDAGASPEAVERAVAGSLALPVRVPDLRRAGFELAAISVYPGQGRRPVQLDYRDRQGRRFAIFLAGPSGPDGFEIRAQGPMRICIWRNAELSAVMTGEMSTGEMLRLASLTYADLEF